MKVYFRGTTPGETKRIRTGTDEWDNNLFCSIFEDKAKLYGSSIEKIALKENANVLTEGTKEFRKVFKTQKKMQSLLDWCTAGIIKCRELGIDVVEFERQGDVGTVILNQDMVIRNYKG